MSLVQGAYGVLMRCLSPFLPWWLSRRAKAGKEDPTRLHQRFARNLEDRPDGQLVWMHGASVGESLILLAVADQLQATRPGLNVLFTSQTLTSADIVARRSGALRLHQMAPLDTPGTARRFMSHWHPDLAVFSEGEIWPHLLNEADKRGVPLALVNARMTESSLKGWMRVRRTARNLFSRFDLMIAANRMTAEALTQLSGKDVAAPGNLKSALPPPPSDPSEEARLRAGFVGDRACVLAASTHPGEEALFLKSLKDLLPQTCAIIAPRHPERGNEIRAQLEAGGWTYAQRSKNEPVTQDTRVYLADTLGEMGLFYSLSDVVYLGGASVPGVGGHNPIEPLGFGKPIVTGPHGFNFADMYSDLQAEGGLSIAATKDELTTALLSALAEPAAHTLSETDRIAFMSRSNTAMRITVAGLLALLETAAVS